MAHFQRVIWFLVGVLLAAVPMLAFSAGITWSVENTTSFRAGSKDGACAARFNNWVSSKTGTGWGYRVEGSGQPDTSKAVGTWQSLPVGNSCWATKNGADYQQFYPFYYRLDACGAGESRLADGTCGAPPKTPQQECEEAGGHWGLPNEAYVASYQCYPAQPNCPKAGDIAVTGVQTDARCGLQKKDCAPEDATMTFAGVLGGGKCLYGKAGNEDQPCPAGTSEVYVEGVKLCREPNTPEKTDETDIKLTPLPDGKTKETKVRKKVETETEVDSETGEKTEKVTTTTTTTTIIRNADGSVESESVETATGESSKNGFCEQNPNSKVCGGGERTFAGICGEQPSCQGDSIECAIAAATFKTHCMVETSKSVLQEFEDMKNYDAHAPGNGLDRKTMQLPSSLNVSMQGGGTGLSDVSFTVWGVEVTLPFSRLNDFLDMIGYAMLAIAWIRAYQIVSSSM